MALWSWFTIPKKQSENHMKPWSHISVLYPSALLILCVAWSLCYTVLSLSLPFFFPPVSMPFGGGPGRCLSVQGYCWIQIMFHFPGDERQRVWLMHPTKWALLSKGWCKHLFHIPHSLCFVVYNQTTLFSFLYKRLLLSSKYLYCEGFCLCVSEK